MRPELITENVQKRPMLVTTLSGYRSMCACPSTPEEESTEKLIAANLGVAIAPVSKTKREADYSRAVSRDQRI